MVFSKSHDFLKLALTPLMANKMGLKKVVMDTVNILKSIEIIDARKSEIITNVLILLTDKLFEGKEKEEIEEALRMCDLVKKFIEEGKDVGKIEGRIEEKIEIAKNLLDILNDETIARKTGLTIEEVKKLREKSLN